MKHTLSGDLTRARAQELATELESLGLSGVLELDFSQVANIDTAGVAIMAAFARRARDNGVRIEISGMSDNVTRTLDLFPLPDLDQVQKVHVDDLVERFAETLQQAREWGLPALFAAVR